MARILIVEDEARIASFVAKGLKADGHQATVVGDGPGGLDHALSGDYELMVLDIGLPGIDGFEVLDQLRSQGSRMPVIVLTARDSVGDTVTALENGADDYMPKPFRFAELQARIRLRLRQAPGNEGGGGRSGDVVEAGGVALDVRTRRATVDGRQVDLSAREFT
ncbi:MAG: response regulator transcription factor, partial [Nocardioides sp.]|nr:response regulator transcription factor [Nocardioides sp.]